jgi:hypothetical protein
MSETNSIKSHPKEKWLFALIWSRADILGLFSNPPMKPTLSSP